MSRVKVLNESLWHGVPNEVLQEAKDAASKDTCWIVMQGNGHIVALEGPGSPDIATGDISYIAEISPAEP
jgi:hypothetical protein